MILPELWEQFTSGKWVSRKAWRKNFAIRLCNLRKKDEEEVYPYDIPILMEDTQGNLYHFGRIQTPKMMRRSVKRKMLSGLQYDLLANDWFLADQTQCDIALKECENVRC